MPTVPRCGCHVLWCGWPFSMKTEQENASCAMVRMAIFYGADAMFYGADGHVQSERNRRVPVVPWCGCHGADGNFQSERNRKVPVVPWCGCHVHLVRTGKLQGERNIEKVPCVCHGADAMFFGADGHVQSKRNIEKCHVCAMVRMAMFFSLVRIAIFEASET